MPDFVMNMRSPDPYLASEQINRLTIEASRNNRVEDEVFRAQLMKACREMEAAFINEMMNCMGSEGGLFGAMAGGTEGEIWGGFLQERVSSSIADAGGLGLARMIFENLISRYETNETETEEEQILE